MKNKCLKEVMGQQFHVTVSESGYEITNGAGTANYDAWGSRTTVNGIPEYFPTSIKVTDANTKKSLMTVGNITDSVEAIIKNAMLSTTMIPAGAIMSTQSSSDAREMKATPDPAIQLILSVIKKELRPGGLLYRSLSR